MKEASIRTLLILALVYLVWQPLKTRLLVEVCGLLCFLLVKINTVAIRNRLGIVENPKINYV